MNRFFRLVLCSLGATVAPLLILTAYLTLTRGPFYRYQGWDVPALVMIFTRYGLQSDKLLDIP